MLTTLKKNEHGEIFHSDHIPESLFNFYVLRKQTFSDGTANWKICCELASDNAKFMVIDAVRGTQEDAVKKLEEILEDTKNKRREKKNEHHYRNTEAAGENTACIQ